MEFNELIGFKKAIENEENKTHRAIARKSGHPTQNAKNFADENKQFGVKNDVDLVL